MALVGTILREPDLLKVGTFCVDEDAIILDIPDENLKAKLQREMQKEWAAQNKPKMEMDSRIGEQVIKEPWTIAKPTNRKTLRNFFTMLRETGFIYTDMNDLEDERCQ